ncbi:MAG TPA: oxygenase MpaB family protein, partial [Bacteroidia bacterium]|nr:oxygenase MpaB family protein [Bacteroidia bacterium]
MSSQPAQNKWENDLLQKMSLQTDPEADKIIGDIMRSEKFGSLKMLFTSLSKDHDKIVKSNLPASVIDYFNSEMTLPAWADQEKIKRAQAVYVRYGPQIALLLNFKSLPLCYACKNGAKALAATGRLNGKDVSKTMRRLFETSQMVMNVMSPGGLSPNGAGIVTVKKVRLYHAAIRGFLMQPDAEGKVWDTGFYGAPISQEEIAGTLMAFSALVLGGLEQLGAQLSEEEKDAYIHCWVIVGHFIGLHPSLYPANFREGWTLGITIIKRNHHSSKEGKDLITSLIDFSESFFSNSLADKILFGGTPPYLAKYFVGDVAKEINVDILDELGIKKKNGFFVLLKGAVFITLIKLACKYEKHNIFIRKIISVYGLRFLKGLISQYLKTNHVAFYIPPSLK